MTSSDTGRPGTPPESGRLVSWFKNLVGFERGTVDATLAGVWSALWRKKRIIVVLAGVGALIGFLVASSLDRKYVAYMRLVPNTEDDLGGNLGRLSSLGGLANLAGGLTKPERVSPFQQYLAVMTSTEVAREMERRGQFLAGIFPGRWDETTQTWRPREPGFLPASKKLIKRALGLPTPPHPTEEDLANQIAKRIGVTENDENSIYVISFAHKDPLFAVKFIQTLYDSTEAVLLRRDLETATRKVRAAERELATATVSASRDALAEILIALNLRMIQASVGSPYAAQVLSAAEVSAFPSLPHVPAFIIFGFGAGMLLGVFVLATTALTCGRKDP